MEERQKGLAFALASSVCFGALILISKHSMRTLNPWTHSAFVFVSGAICYVLLSLARRDFAAFRPSSPLLGRTAILGAVDCVMFVCLMTGIQMLGPATASFLQQSWYVLTIIAGILFLKERFTPREKLGLGMGLAGAVLIAYTKGFTVQEGAVVIWVGGVAFAANFVLVRHWTKKHNPIHLAFYRAIFVAAFLTVISTARGVMSVPQMTDLLVPAVAGFVGPFLNYLMLYLALRRVEAGRVALTRPVSALVVLIFGYVFFGHLPTETQFIGAGVLISGLVLLNLSKMRRVQASKA